MKSTKKVICSYKNSRVKSRCSKKDSTDMKKHYWNECEIINIFLSKLKFGLLKLLITSMKRLEDFKQKYMEIVFPLIQQQMNIKVENHVLMHHISQNRQRINWTQIDMVLNKKQLSSGVTFSEKYFVDVIKPFFL